MSRASVREALEIVQHTGPHVTGDRIAHLRNLRSDRYRLKDDLVISISEEDDGFVARSFDLGQYGCGPSTDDAIDHLCSVVEDYFDLLQEERDGLSRQLTSHLRYLEFILEKI